MTSQNSSTFFSNIPLLESFFEASDPTNYHPIPGDWYVAVTDIVNSTEAIQNDQYKTVNILGASPIVGVLNLTDKDEIPYTFGGDGCTLCIPPSLLEECREIFNASQQIGQAEYGLTLRAAIIPIQSIREAGYDVKVAKYQVSKVYNQAVFSGGGLDYAEKILKTSTDNEYGISSSEEAGEVDFTGLECRWQEVNQQGKQVITLLVKCNPGLENAEKIYREVLQKMRQVFGFDDKTNPIAPSQLNMQMSVSALMGETRFRTFGMSWIQRLLYLLKTELQIIAGKLFMAIGHESSATNWGRYKTDLALNSDHRKFDDMLRVVISGTRKQCRQLQSFLQQKFESSELAYGMHVSDKAVITCMVFKYHRDHIHFVDGDKGGYVIASQKLKQRLEALSEELTH